MNNDAVIRIAMEQSAIDCNCKPADFQGDRNVVVVSRANPGAKEYLKLPFLCDLVSFGSNIVASVDERVVEFVQRYLEGREIESCFETPAIHIMTKGLAEYGMVPCYMAEYFLPDVDALRLLDCPYPTELLQPEGFSDLYVGPWENALCENRRDLDMLAVVAYDGGRIVGMAGCSADSDTMWQIGIDVLPQYRRRGVAAALTSYLAREILARGKVPFYCSAWANIKSVRNALRCGFKPAWVHLTTAGSKKVLTET